MEPCQRDPYLQIDEATVRSCEPAGARRWSVRTTPTILYPEGGGQPADRGVLSSGGRAVAVVDVQRVDGEIVLTTTGPVEGDVAVQVAWERRFDHMQQHTGQHLLTAVLQDGFGLATTSFHLGTDVCWIELDGPGLPPDVLVSAEATVAEAIRAARPVRWREVRPEDLDGLGVRTRGLPDGFDGPVRLVEIEGIDLNTCGGTHLTNTAQLEALVLLTPEAAREGRVRLPFLAGGRVRAALHVARTRERVLTDRLKAQPADHVEAVERLLEARRDADKALARTRRELAGVLGEALARSEGVATLHRAEADLPFLQAVASAFGQAAPAALLLATGGDREGVFLLAGPADDVAAVGPAVAGALGGRGGGAKGRYQGRAGDLSEAARAAARRVVEDHRG